MSEGCTDAFGSVNNAVKKIVAVANELKATILKPLNDLLELIKAPLKWIEEQIDALYKAISESDEVQCLLDVFDNMNVIGNVLSCPVDMLIVEAFNAVANPVADLIETVLNSVRLAVATELIDAIIPDNIDLTLNLPDPLASLSDSTIFEMCLLTGGEYTSIEQAVKVPMEEKLTEALGVKFEFGQPLTLFNSNALQIQLINDVIASPITIPRMEVNKGCQDAWQNLIDGPDPSGCVHKLVSDVNDHFTKPKEHGEICAWGTTCKLCTDGYATYWAKQLGTRCGEEPKWDVGEMCAAGTTCEGSCPGGVYDHWYTKGYWACGKEPKNWSDGTYCFAGTSCTRCANGDSWWFGKGGQHCGAEPCWSPGTVCGAGTTCNWECCGGRHYAPWWQLGLGHCL